MSGGGSSDWNFNMDGVTGILHLNEWDSPNSVEGYIQLSTGAFYLVKLSDIGNPQFTMTALLKGSELTLNFSGCFGGESNHIPGIMAGSFLPQNDSATGRAWYAQMEQICTVTSDDGLNVRAAATSQSAIVNRFSPGTALGFFEVVAAESVANNPNWGHSVQGYYFWLGGTNRPNG